MHPHVRRHLLGDLRRVLLSSVSSDAHTWNLVYLQLLIEEMGPEVINLGACVPDALLISEALRVKPDLIVLSTVNGHGYGDGKRVITALRAHHALRDLPVVIGGKLGVGGPISNTQTADLLAAGFDAVFGDDAAPESFRRFLDRLVPSSTGGECVP